MVLTVHMQISKNKAALLKWKIKICQDSCQGNELFRFHIHVIMLLHHLETLTNTSFAVYTFMQTRNKNKI